MRAIVRNDDAEGSRRGFTMVEVIVVLVIISVLAAVLAPSVSRYMDRAQGKSAARDVTNMLRMARNQAMSRGEVVLVDVDNFEDDDDGHGRIELYRTDLSSTSGCDPSDPTDTDCFALSCAQATTATLSDSNLDMVHSFEISDNSPEMLILDMEPSPSGNGPEGMLCFSPSGRVLEAGGLPLSEGGSGDCDQMSVRVWVRQREADAESVDALKQNPLDGAGLADCVSNEEDYESQRQGRQVANFWEIEIPYNGSITMTQ